MIKRHWLILGIIATIVIIFVAAIFVLPKMKVKAKRGLIFLPDDAQFMVDFPSGYYEKTALGKPIAASLPENGMVWGTFGLNKGCVVGFSEAPEIPKSTDSMTREKEIIFHLAYIGMIYAKSNEQIEKQNIQDSVSACGHKAYSVKYIAKRIGATGDTYYEIGHSYFVFTETRIYRLKIELNSISNDFSNKDCSELEADAKFFFESFHENSESQRQRLLLQLHRNGQSQ